VKDEGPGAISLPVAFTKVEMLTGVMSASTEDMSSCAFGSSWKCSFPLSGLLRGVLSWLNSEKARREIASSSFLVH
jgi:hypothetical protein